MGENTEKRMVAGTGYEVIHEITMGDREVIIAEDMTAHNSQYYMKAEYRENGIIGEYSNIIYDSDYNNIMQEFLESLYKQLSSVKEDIGFCDFQPDIIKPDHCYPHDYSQDLTDKVVVVKASALRPEYRRGDNQLVYITHGGGAKANPRSTGIFCYHLNDGTTARYERHQVQGIIKHLPFWAKEQLDFFQNERKPVIPEPTQEETVGNYKITMRIQVGNTKFVLGENPKAPAPYATWQQHEGRNGYDLGHYLTDRDVAIKDLNRRASNARANLSVGISKEQKEHNSAR
jgi:hypothetical protein